MADLLTLRAKAKVSNSLLCLLTGLRGRTVTIELRNENSVVGCVEAFDERMNATLTDAKFTTLSGASAKFEHFYIQGSNIRYVHIPPSVNIMSTMKKQLQMIHGKNRRKFKVPGTVTKKAQRDIDREKQRRLQRKECINKLANSIKERILRIQNQDSQAE